MKPEISRRAARVWERLRQWYGARLAEQFGEEPPSEWRRLVDRSSDADIKRGLDIVRARHAAYPPTLMEFESALRPPPRPVSMGGDATVQERMVEHIVKTRALSRAQLSAVWTWLYERAQWTDINGRPRDELATCIGVVIPAVDGHPAIRVMVGEMGEQDRAA